MLLDIIDGIAAGLSSTGLPKFFRWIGLKRAADWIMGKKLKSTRRGSKPR